VTLILGDFNTIVGGFSRGETAAASQKALFTGCVILRDLEAKVENLIY